MSVTERQRHQLLAWYEQHMGPELAAVAMELTPPTSWGDLATKRDLDQLGNQLRNEMAQLRSEMHGEIAQLGGELRGEIGELRGEIRAIDHKIDGEIGKLRAEMHQLSSRNLRTFIGLLIATQTAVVAILTLVR